MIKSQQQENTETMLRDANQNLKRNSLKTHMLKHVNSNIMAKTNEIATFRPSRIHMKTICFLIFMKTTSPLNIYKKT